ncbi:MAG TPA: hypothetical protein VFG58_04875 [Solirubrobacterales bacterium]|nr:hypothetical protein [Solirubrobacterales bacterium]
MHDKPNGKTVHIHPDRDQVLREQAIVLTHVLALDPDHETILALARSLDAEPGDFKRTDAVERAVRDLTGAGLLEIASGEVHPTPAARRFLEIVESGV